MSHSVVPGWFFLAYTKHRHESHLAPQEDQHAKQKIEALMQLFQAAQQTQKLSSGLETVLPAVSTSGLVSQAVLCLYSE